MITEKTDFQLLTFDADTKLVSITWQENTKLMTEEQYRNEQLQTRDFCLKNKPAKLCVNTQNLFFVITPDLQVWTDVNLVQPLIEQGVSRFAFIMPEDIFTQVSIQQAVEENPQQLESTRFFDKEAEGMSWLLKG
ncbi:hypothetical protein [Thermoflexibacter ruber]|uniref:SpoIIAA-like n=1 Tax=Thermoflexibacter ruber TaxID=1003 RepID=A0A1I2J2Y5_9BACT|nr:hypothetical protein [Thermoflexibacter ruber]SFF49072.1 hypothetical protein SAMN04488541_104127 [Thermoflexibacter ruber]